MSQIVREFFTYRDELWYHLNDGTTERLTEKSCEVVGEMLDFIEQLYPKAFKALSKEYICCSNNFNLYRFRIVNRFCKCNFGNIDNVDDIDRHGRLHLEYVPCPLRGECRFEGVVCSPQIETRLTPGEIRVLRLWYDGFSCEEISEKLYLSIHTINNHIRRAMYRLGFHEKAEFFRYAERNHIFKQ